MSRLLFKPPAVGPHQAVTFVDGSGVPLVMVDYLTGTTLGTSTVARPDGTLPHMLGPDGATTLVVKAGATALSTTSGGAESAAPASGGGVSSTDLTDAVTTLQVALGLKQDSSTAATDSEVSAIQSALSALITANTTAIGTETSRAQGAESSEVTARGTAVSAEATRAQAAEALAQPALTAATDAEVAALIATRMPVPLSGTLANRPSAATFGVGIYVATDQSGGTPYYSDGTSWSQLGGGINPSGKVLDSGRITSDFTMTQNGAWTDVPGLTATIPAGMDVDVAFVGTPNVASGGTVVTGTVINLQVRVVDVATATTLYYFKPALMTAVINSGTSTNPGMGGNWAGRKQQAALGSSTPVKTQVLCPVITGLGTAKVSTTGGLDPTMLEIVAR